MKAHLLVQLEYPDGGLTAPQGITVECTEPPILEVRASKPYGSDYVYPGESVWFAFSVDGEGGLAGCTLTYQCTPPELSHNFGKEGTVWKVPNVDAETQVMLIFYVQRDDGSQSGSVGVPIRVLPNPGRTDSD